MAMLNNQRVYFLGKGTMLGPTLARWLETIRGWTNTRRSHSVGQVDAEDSEHVEAIASGSSIGDDPREVFGATAGAVAAVDGDQSGTKRRIAAWEIWLKTSRVCETELHGTSFSAGLQIIGEWDEYSYHETLTTSVNLTKVTSANIIWNLEVFFSFEDPPKSEG